MKDDWIVNKSDLILVTGSNGFVGSKVVETLIGHGFKRLRCLYRSSKNLSILQNIAASHSEEVELLNGNLLSRDDCQRAVEGVSLIYHLAAGTGKSYPACILNSVVTTRNLLDAAIKEKTLKRFVNISSIAVYSNENIHSGGLMDESCEVDEHILERHEPYTYAKRKQDQLVLDYAINANLPHVIVRPSVVFGPGKTKITGRVGIDTFGVFLHLGLNNTIPLTYVDNCSEAIVLAGLINGIDGHVFNIVDDDLPTSKKFLKLYKKNVSKFITIPVPYLAWYLFNLLWEKYSKRSGGQLPPTFNRRYCSSFWKGNTYTNIKAKKLLGWEPRIPMNEALERFFGYMRKEKVQK